MNGLRTTGDVLLCFRDIDRQDVDVQGLAFPLDVDPVATWASGPRAYLLLRDHANRAPKGIVFRRNGGTSPDVATMCQWCHRVRAHGGVKLLSVRSSERRWVGQYLCSDLGCLSSNAAIEPDDLRESLDVDARARRTLERIRAFAARRIF